MSKRSEKTRDMISTAMMTALTVLCAWINIPATVPFTMQTFAVFASLHLLGGRRTLMMVTVYLTMGAAGMPVFAGFDGGLSCLLGPTGGYLIGFMVQAAIYWLMTARLGDGKGVCLAAILLGLCGCYLFGTVWFVRVYAKGGGKVGFMTALGWCVLPYVGPDLLKMALAWTLCARLKRRINL